MKTMARPTFNSSLISDNVGVLFRLSGDAVAGIEKDDVFGLPVRRFVSVADRGPVYDRPRRAISVRSLYFEDCLVRRLYA